jgi:Family of unknown function (DUF6588)
MKKSLLLLTLLIFVVKTSFSQIEDRFSQLAEHNAVEYAKPFATTLGTAMNSSGYISADYSSLFSFSISFRGMYIIIPESQKTFTPTFNDVGYQATKETATIYGDKGAAYAGPDGYIVMPPGINQSGIPVAYPQVAASFMGTQVLLRYLPKIPLGNENDLSLLGIGVAHSISQYIPLFPIDLAVQILYNNFEITNLMNLKNIAFNAHASKTFGLITPYFGLQYEKTSLDLSYTIKGDPQSGDPGLQQDKDVSVTINGDNNFRATVGAALKLAVIVLNADFSLSSQPVVTGGLTFEF